MEGHAFDATDLLVEEWQAFIFAFFFFFVNEFVWIIIIIIICSKALNRLIECNYLCKDGQMRI